MVKPATALIAGSFAARLPAVATMEKQKMKSLFLATAAVAAFAAAPAFAQDSVGSIGVNYSNTDIDVAGLNGEAETASVDVGVAIPVTSDWTVTVDGGFNLVIDGADDADDSSTNGRVHASRNFGNVRVGAFAGGAEAADEQLWSFGAEAQAYLNDKVTVTGVVAYETVESTDADIWSVGGDASYFISPTFRVNAGAGWSTADLGAGVDGDGWSANVGGEYQFPGTGISVAAGYVRSEIEDLDLQADTINVGLRFSFGGDLQTRQRSGADLGRTAVGVGSLLGGL